MGINSEGCSLSSGPDKVRGIRFTHAGVLEPMVMIPDTKTNVPTRAAGRSQAV